MIRPLITFLLFALVSIHCTAQSRLRKLPPNINHPAINVTSPYISLDGNSLVFISDNSDDNLPTMFYTTKKDAVNWNDPVIMPRTVNNRLNFLNGFAPSADGKTLYLSSLKSGGLGGFDIVVSQLKGTVWTEPANLGLPINSPGHEACPSLTADESTLYFMRCEKMDQKAASECKILVSKKSRLGRWEDPEELPAFINTGNSQAPRILGDGETLIFSSDKFPENKGGMDLYMTRLMENKWSQPVPLAFANSSQHDQYVSASSLGRYLLKDQPGARTSEIVEILFPPDVKPKATLKIDGLVTGLDNLSSPYIAVFDLKNQKRIFNGRPQKNGAFTIFLKEGTIYDLAVEPERETFTFYSKRYDLTADPIPQLDKVDVSIKPISIGTEIDLAVDFEKYSARTTPYSLHELRRVARMIKGNPDFKFQIDVVLQGYQQDAVQSSPDLTEVIIDTLHFKVEKQIPDTTKLDALLVELNKIDSLENISSDSVQADVNARRRSQLDSIRSTAFIIMQIDSMAIKRTFHNDRTTAQALEIIAQLTKEGASSANLGYYCKAIPEPIAEKRKTLVRLKVIK